MAKVRGRYKRKEKLQVKIEEKGFGVDYLSKEYGLAYLREKVVPLVEAKPAKGLLVAQESAKRFRAYGNDKPRLSLAVRTFTNCLANLCDGLEAVALRTLGRAVESAEILNGILDNTSCPACIAENQRFISMSYLALGETTKASGAIKSAIDGYRQLADVGHNLSGNPTASCLIYNAHIEHCSGDNRRAIQHVRRARSKLNPAYADSRPLYYAATINLSTYLFWEKEYTRAEPILEEAAQYYYSEPELTIGQTITTWFRGVLRARKVISGLSCDWRRRGRPESLLELARNQAFSLGLIREAIMITADLLAYYVLLTQSFWLAETALTERVCKGAPESAVKAYREVVSAIHGQDTLSLWLGLRNLRQYDPQNELAIPFILPEWQAGLHGDFAPRPRKSP